MVHIVFASRPQATKFASDVDAELGLPLDGVDMGPGPHAPKALTRSVRFAELRKHPVRSEWAYPDMPLIKGKRDRVPVPPGAVVKELEPDWTPPGNGP